jgi:two-component system capsular synthesis sensor histidine kinase RcsC
LDDHAADDDDAGRERAAPDDVIFNDGRRIVLLTGAAAIKDRDGATIGAVCAFTDVSSMKELQRAPDARRREAEEASVRRTRFLAAVAHDIRTPASAINLMAELIHRTAEDRPIAGQVPKLAAELRGSAATLVELVSDVLDVARFAAPASGASGSDGGKALSPPAT